MKTTLKIARTELQNLFYSPVAWLILVVFTCQATIVYTDYFNGFVKYQAMKFPLNNASLGIFAGMKGLFPAVQSYLFLYIPPAYDEHHQQGIGQWFYQVVVFFAHSPTGRSSWASLSP